VEPVALRVLVGGDRVGELADAGRQIGQEAAQLAAARSQVGPQVVRLGGPCEQVEGLGERTRRAVGALLPGPVTLVVANPQQRYPLACREDRERLGIRLLGGPLAGAMCPIFQTSANLSGEPAPASFGDIPAEIVDASDLAIDGGVLTGLPSTVVDLTSFDEDDEWTVLRAGGLDPTELGERLKTLISR